MCVCVCVRERERQRERERDRERETEIFRCSFLHSIHALSIAEIKKCPSLHLYLNEALAKTGYLILSLSSHLMKKPV